MGLQPIFLTCGRGPSYPDGGNQLDVDGSVHWAKLESLVACTSEDTSSGIYDFIYEDNLVSDLQAVGAPAGYINQIKAGRLSPQFLFP